MIPFPGMRRIKLPCKTYPTGSVGSGLPPGYQECDWLESDGYQWIDTGIIPNWNEDIEIQWCSYGGETPVWGADNFVYQAGYLRIFSLSGIQRYAHVDGRIYTGAYAASTGVFTLTTDYDSPVYQDRSSDACQANMHLFKRFSHMYSTRGRIMYAKMGTHHFVPALHTASNEGVMVDISTGVVYHNKGIGAFTWQVKSSF